MPLMTVVIAVAVACGIAYLGTPGFPLLKKAFRVLSLSALGALAGSLIFSQDVG